METSREELKKRYSDMDDDSIVGLYRQDTLTPIAKELILEELSKRKINTHPESLRRKYQEPTSTAPTAKESARVASGCIVKAFVVAIFLIIINVVLFGFGQVIAPLIWTSSIDRQCQQKGYWYGSRTNEPNKIMCDAWWAGPR